MLIQNATAGVGAGLQGRREMLTRTMMMMTMTMMMTRMRMTRMRMTVLMTHHLMALTHMIWTQRVLKHTCHGMVAMAMSRFWVLLTMGKLRRQHIR